MNNNILEEEIVTVKRKYVSSKEQSDGGKDKNVIVRTWNAIGRIGRIIVGFSTVIGAIATIIMLVNNYNAKTEKIADTYILMFNPNGGTGGKVSQKFAVKNGVSESEKLYGGTPIRIGYTFLCWNSKEDGSGEDYYNGDNIYLDRDIVLYAVWTPTTVPARYIRFNANGGTGTPVIQIFELDNDGKSEEKALNGDILTTRPGYTFVEWNKMPDGSGASFDRNEIVVLNISNATLYAIWRKE